MQTLFFGTKRDIVPILQSVEEKLGVRYAAMGLFSAPEVRMIERGESIPNLGNATDESAINCDSYLVTMPDAMIAVRAVPQDDGGVSFAVDQLENPDSITFQAGGRLSDDVFLHGRVGTVSDTEVARRMYRAYHSEIKKRFKKVNAFFVSPDCLNLLQNGVRLTIAAQSPREFDLVP